MMIVKKSANAFFFFVLTVFLDTVAIRVELISAQIAGESQRLGGAISLLGLIGTSND